MIVRIQELGSEIRKVRQARGLTQAQLARAAGLSRETLNLLESGLVRDLGIRKALALTGIDPPLLAEIDPLI